MIISVLNRVENIVVKFAPFPTMFSTGFFPRGVKRCHSVEWVKNRDSGKELGRRQITNLIILHNAKTDILHNALLYLWQDNLVINVKSLNPHFETG